MRDLQRYPVVPCHRRYIPESYCQEPYKIQIILVLVFLLLLLSSGTTATAAASLVFVVIRRRRLRPLPMPPSLLIDNDLPEVEEIVCKRHYQPPPPPLPLHPTTILTMTTTTVHSSRPITPGRISEGGRHPYSHPPSPLNYPSPYYSHSSHCRCHGHFFRQNFLPIGYRDQGLRDTPTTPDCSSRLQLCLCTPLLHLCGASKNGPTCPPPQTPGSDKLLLCCGCRPHYFHLRHPCCRHPFPIHPTPTHATLKHL